MLLSSSSSDITGVLLERERQFNSAREMDGGTGEGELRLFRLAVQQVGMTGVRELAQSEGIGESWGRCWLREGPEPRWMKQRWRRISALLAAVAAATGRQWLLLLRRWRSSAV